MKIGDVLESKMQTQFCFVSAMIVSEQDKKFLYF